MSEYIIEVKNVSMRFNLCKEKVDSAKEYFIKLVKRDLRFEEFWALKDVSLNIQKGEAIGIVGLNGSGKSTLLKVIAGVLKPSKGNVKIYGTIAPLIELGAGFDMDLTARENIFLNGAILGYSHNTMAERYDEIVEFSELEEFIDVPLKNYSSGMLARLGFSIATISKPDVLIVDEILSVGDFQFQEKCEERIKGIIESGATVIFVSHTLNQVEKLCNRVLWLKKGEMQMLGPTDQVCYAYKNG